MRILIAVLAFASLSLVACKPTIPTKDGSVTINDGNGSVSVKGPDGTMDIDGKDGNVTMKDDKGNEIKAGTDASDASIGIAIYPGAKKHESGGMTMNLASGTVSSFTYLSGDSVAKVGEFYKRELPTATTTSTNAGGNEIQTLNLEEPKKKIIVMILRKKGDVETTISIRSETMN